MLRPSSLFWKQAAAQPMRAATYTVPPAPGDTASAECGVYFFGAGQGGSVEATCAAFAVPASLADAEQPSILCST